ncbi:acyltransferase family protein [Priestia endophytica]|uniref:acyltransferase family protein n=1 Tax=Priestia endophytica TaxID=135735 RepID=UPI002E1A69B7|nr:acyltransferase family protein [Priestia endophytica]MED4072079.1 acyltransferase family protein [Priestia endophytica]
MNQSFFMGLFFFLSGYFTPNSYDRKDPMLFIRERFIRLGIPIIFYIFLLSPIIQFMILESKTFTFWQFYKTKILSFESIDIGPLWFVEALLIFNFIYFIVRIVRKEPSTYKQKSFPRVRTLFITAFSLGIIVFFRMVFPVGKTLMGLQLGYFPPYILLFVAGIIANRQNWLRDIPTKIVRNWVRILLFISPLLPLGLILVPEGKLEGGLNLLALIYAMWEPFVGIDISIALLAGFRKYMNHTNLFTRKLSDTTYTVYIIHPLNIVGYSLIVYSVSFHPLLKFGIVGTIGTITCFVVAIAICKIPYAKRVL